MKKLKLFVSLLCCAAVALSSLTYPVYAKSSDGLNVNFDEFYFSTYDYDKDRVNIEYIQVGLSKVAIIRDKHTGEVLEIMTVESSKPNSAYVYPYTLKRSRTYGGTTLQLSVDVELYNYGSYRQINSILGYRLDILNSDEGLEFEDYNVSVWAPGDKFPTTELFYAYNGTLFTKVDASTTNGIEAKVLEIGFGYGKGKGKTMYYRRPFGSTGRLRLY